MNTLRQAVQDYLSLRRSLGFNLHDAGKVLLDFVTFMERHRTSYITQALALAWAQQPVNVQSAQWAKRLSFVRGFARHRSATDSRTQIPAQGLLPFRRGGRGRTCTRRMKSEAYCALLSTCPVVVKPANCDLGLTMVCSDY